MGVLGGAGGYATVTPIQGNPIGESMQNVENSAFKYNAQRIADERTRIEEEQNAQNLKDARLKEDIAYADKHKIIPTTIGSVNKAVLDFSVDNKNMYSQAKDILRTSNNPEERRAATETMTNLESSFEIAKALPEMLNASAKDLEEGVRAGKYNPLSSTKAAETIDAMSKGDMKVVFKPNGIPAFITYKRDGKGNLTEIIDKELTLDQLKQKLSPVMAFDSSKNDIDFEKSLGKVIETEEGDYVVKGYPNLEESADKNANSIVTNVDKMYGIAPDAGVTPKTNLSDYTPDEIKKVKDYIKSGLVEKFKPSKTTNDAKLARRLAERKEANDQKNSDRTYNQQERKAGAEKKDIKVTVKNGILGEEVTITKNMTEEQLAEYNANKSKQAVKTQEEVWANPIATGYSKAAKNSPKKYSATQEKAIATALKNNPGYTRAEIIAALKL